jgi:hypothetical protein
VREAAAPSVRSHLLSERWSLTAKSGIPVRVRGMPDRHAEGAQGVTAAHRTGEAMVRRAMVNAGAVAEFQPRSPEGPGLGVLRRQPSVGGLVGYCGLAAWPDDVSGAVR